MSLPADTLLMPVEAPSGALREAEIPTAGGAPAVRRIRLAPSAMRAGIGTRLLVAATASAAIWTAILLVIR